MAEPKLVRAEDDFEPELITENDDSVVEDRTPRAPQLKKLGRYRLVREIASGGMASMNLAVTEGLDKLVALKMIHPHLAQEQAFVGMFLDEARIASSISHRNVCSTFDFGETDGRYYIAMEYLAGHSLRDLIVRLRKIKQAELTETRKLSAYMAYILAEACEGLHAAHELRDPNGQLLQVVHRDVSPHNLFLTYDGNVSVVDFGIARASDRIQHTATGVLKGKFSYMAPEQVRQLEVDRRADIWALGVCLWESITLERLFVRSSQADTLMSVMMDRIRPPSEVRPEIPKALDDICIKALARNPAQRYATAREMGRDLMQAVRESSVLAGSVELEQWMEKLFPREREDARQLTRYAKQAAIDSSWLEATPAGFPRIPTRSGAMAKAQSGSISRSELVAHSGIALRRAPDNDSEATPDVEISPHETSSASMRRRTILAAVIGLSAAVGLTWGLPRSAPEAAPVSSLVQPAAPAVVPQVVVGDRAIGLHPAAEVVDPAANGDLAAQEIAAPELEAPADEDTRAKARNIQAPERRALAARAASTGTVATAKEKPSSSEAASRGALPAEPSPAIPDVRATATPEPKAPVTGSVPNSTPSTRPAPETAPAVAESAPREAIPAAPVPVAAPAAPAPAPVVAARAPAAPAQKLDASASFESLEVEGSLGSGVVQRMLSRANPLVRTCYVEAAKRAGKNDFSPLAVSLSIDEMGAVRDVRPGSHQLSGLASCVASSVKRLRSERKPDVGTVRVRLNVSFRGQ